MKLQPFPVFSHSRIKISAEYIYLLFDDRMKIIIFLNVVPRKIDAWNSSSLSCVQTFLMNALIMWAHNYQTGKILKGTVHENEQF